jgi:hypothetical protein
MSPGSDTIVVSVVAAASLPMPEPLVPPPSSAELEDLLRPLAAQLIWCNRLTFHCATPIG